MCCLIVYSDQFLVGSSYTVISYHDKLFYTFKIRDDLCDFTDLLKLFTMNTENFFILKTSNKSAISWNDIIACSYRKRRTNHGRILNIQHVSMVKTYESTFPPSPNLDIATISFDKLNNTHLFISSITWGLCSTHTH